MNLAKVSVVIPTYNRSRLLSMLLSTIERQTYNSNLIETIVVDDGSHDDTEAVVSLFQSSLDVKYLFQEDKGYRVGSARNLGLTHATGDIVVFIDSGVLLSSGCIAAHVGCHATGGGKVAIGYILGLSDNEESLKLITEVTDTHGTDQAIEILLGYKECLDIREEVYSICDSNLSTLPAPWVLFWTGNVSARRLDLVNAGMFDENYDGRWGIEDVDLGYRLFKNNVTFELCRQASSIHCPHEGDRQKKLIDEFHNKRYFHRKFNNIESLQFLTSNTVSLNLMLNLTMTPF